MRKILFFIIFSFISLHSFCWGFYGHKKINYFAVFLLPPEMMQLYKPNIDFIAEHAVDPDMRRYAIAQEGPRHYIDIIITEVIHIQNCPGNGMMQLKKFLKIL